MDLNKSSRATKLYSVIDYYTNRVDFFSHPLADSLAPLQLSSLSQKTNIASSNASMILSQLHKEGRLLRIGKRPIYYLALQPLEISLKLRFPSNQYTSLGEFEDFLASALIGAAQKTAQQMLSGDPFSQLIGACGSLKQQIKQAKSALSYPPAGIHTLLSGPVGAGKESFVKCMYGFALQKKLIPKNADLVIYDCGNYVRNPTQAISRLFGHVAGVTPASKTDHIGLFEYANGGMLLLNNIDKLFPEAQEKLIHYLLTGKYGRLGETDSTRTGNVRVVACTSTDNDSTLAELSRSFPIRISIGSLESRTVGERIRLILQFFWRESRTLKRPITLEAEILNFLTHYSCPGNIGQLMNDIKFSCSLAYYDSLTHSTSDIHVSAKHLSPTVSQNFFINYSPQRYSLIDQQLRHPKQPININGLHPLDEIMQKYLLPDPDVEVTSL